MITIGLHAVPTKDEKINQNINSLILPALHCSGLFPSYSFPNFLVARISTKSLTYALGPNECSYCLLIF